MAFGTLFSLDAVAEDQTTVPAIGEDTLWDNLDAYFAAHNRLFQMVLEQVAETTTDRIRWFGGTDDIDLQELDEFLVSSR